MGKHQSRSLMQGHLKKAVKKLHMILSRIKLSKWNLASICRAGFSQSRRSLSFNDRLGLQYCIVDRDPDEGSSVRVLQRTKSCAYDGDDDIDRRAEIFITNFRRQLLYERQVSLELRYRRGNSFDEY
ncbi:cotton fiber protein [Citrus sinensis]|uniref:Cotton fiber protein n=3 Tax=Citrus TaxID=2706 RepID=A0ACB8NKN8_CITSI|nr:cotton fiber protein [Citrus sinensis]